MIIAFIGGLLSFLSPCVLPLVPGYLCYLGGDAAKDLRPDQGVFPVQRARLVMVALGFVFGFSAVFMALGASASALNAWIAPNLETLSRVAGLVLILMGILAMGILPLPALMREWRFEGPGAAQVGGPLGGFVAGLAFGFGWTPCIGPILAGILTLAAQEQSLAEGVRLLAFYSAGLGLPFVLAAIFLPSMPRLLAFMRRRYGLVKALAGGGLALTGLLMATNSLAPLGFYLLEIFPILGQLG